MKVGLLTPSGWGNLGDAAIQDAVIHAIRCRHPQAEIHGFTLNPQDTRERHGIEAEALSGFSLVPGYRVQLNGARSSTPADPGKVRGEAVATTARRGVARRPGAARMVATADEWLYRALCDGRYLRRMRARLGDFDLVLASGGGQVDDDWGGAWGHPWTLAKWSTLARSLSIPFRVLSVGLCHLDALASRLLARVALRQADYVSFRDENSRRRALEMGLLERAELAPDLAFSHPDLDPAEWVEGDPRTVAVGPMVWKDPQRWAHRDGSAHEAYLRRLSALVGSLLEADRRVVLLPGDDADNATAETLRQRIGVPGLGRLELPRAESVTQLIEALRGAGSVVASRLHLVLLAAALGKPVLPLSYDLKVDALAQDLGLAAYRCEIGSTGPEELKATLVRLEDARTTVRDELRRRVLAFRGRLEAQYEEVLP
jgi:polysaccharide pyruvyl transferase WcaK-like protein